jgi:hypothetical protein
MAGSKAAQISGTTAQMKSSLTFWYVDQDFGFDISVRIDLDLLSALVS